MDKITIKKHFDNSLQEGYARIPFVLPPDVEWFRVAYSYDKAKRTIPGQSVAEFNAVDFALLAPDGSMVGASGNSKSEIYISEIWCTPGYHARPVDEGEWQVLLGLYRLKSDGVDVEICVTYELKHYRWLKGDAHTHTFHSDGKLSVAALATYARRRGLDWIALTDHNVHHAETSMPCQSDFLMMKGMELTGFVGHMNVFGVDKPLEGSYQFTNDDELLALVDEFRKKGAVLSVNHPCCKQCGWHLSLDNFDYECVEVWNGPMRVDNERAVRWWHGELLKGRRLSAVGGSDFHRDYVVTRLLGCPTTAVYAKSNTQTDVLQAMVKGASYVTFGPKSTGIYLSCGDKLQGDEVILQDDTQVNVSVDRLKKNQRLVVYNNDQIIFDFKATVSSPYSVTLPVKQKGFVRAEILFEYGYLAEKVFRLAMKLMMPADAKAEYPPFVYALSNPLYII